MSRLSRSQLDDDHRLAQQMQIEELNRVAPDALANTAPRDELIHNADDLAYSVRASPRCVQLIVLCSIIEVSATIVILKMSFLQATCEYQARLQGWIMLFAIRHLFVIPHEQVRVQAQLSGNRAMIKRVRKIDEFRLLSFIFFGALGMGLVFGQSAASCVMGPDDAAAVALLRTYTMALLFLHFALMCSSIIVVVLVCMCFPCLLLLLRVLQPDTGMTDTEVKSLPERIFNSSDTHADHASNPATCVICQNDYTNGDRLKHLNCNHEFHSECLDHWLVLKATCPLCREPVNTDAFDGNGAPVAVPPV